MRSAAIFCSFFLTLGASAADPNPFAPDGTAVESATPPNGPPRSKAEIERAVEFLDEQPFSPEAARVALDVYIAATVNGDAALARDMWTRLALEHPKSFQHRFLLSANSLEAYRKVLVEAADERGFDADFARRYVTAVCAGLERWQGHFLADDEFQIQFVLASREIDRSGAAPWNALSPEEKSAAVAAPWDKVEGGKAEKKSKEKDSEKDDKKAEVTPEGAEAHLRRGFIAASRVRLLGGEDRPARRVAAVVFDEFLSPTDRVLRLHEIEDGRIARLCEDYFHDRLTPAERTLPAIAESRAELLLDRERFAEALPIVEGLLAESRTAKRIFWKGWCEAAMGRASAADTLDEVAHAFPDDPWRETADAAAAAVRDLEPRLSSQADAAVALCNACQGAANGAVEFWVDAAPEKSGPLTVYAYAAFENGPDAELEVLAMHDGRVVLGTRSGKTGARVFTASTAAIKFFPESLPIPEARFDLQYDATTNSYDMNLSLGTIASSKGGPSTLYASASAVIDRLGIGSSRGVRRHLDRHVAKGYLPGPIESGEKGRHYSWMAFSSRKPILKQSRFHVTNEGKLDLVSTPSVTIRDLRYGPAGSFIPNPPAWPDAPTVRHTEFDAAMMLQLFAEASKLWLGEEAGVPVTAEKGTISPR